MKRTIFLIFMVTISIIFSALFSGILLGIFFPTDGGINISHSLRTFLTFTLTYGISIVVLTFFRRPFFWRIPTPRPELWRIDFSLIVLSLIGIFAVGILIEPFLQYIPTTGLSNLYDKMKGGFWSVITVVFAAPVMEEYIFRGIVQRNAIRFTGKPYLGILLTSLIFALVHFVPQQMVMAFFASIVIGTVYYATRSLFTVITLHLLNNGLAYTFYLYFGESSSIIGPFKVSLTTYWAIYYLCLVYVVVMTLLAIKKINQINKTYTHGCSPINPLQED